MKTSFHFLMAAISLAIATVSNGRCQPVITNQPQSLTNLAGTTATFSIGAGSTLPLAYQWQKDFSDTNFTALTDGTNTTLTLNNVGIADAANYRVVITDADGAVTSAVARLFVILPAYLTLQPGSFPSVSLGANVTNRVAGGGTPPPSFQWWLDGKPVAGQTKSSLVLTNVQLADAGSYTAVVSNDGGSVTSRVSTLIIDSTFTKITSGAIVTDMGLWGTPAWADYNNSGYLSLFVPNSKQSGVNKNALYRNNGDGTFTKVTTGSVVAGGGVSVAASWADYDNDGFPDLFVSNGGNHSPIPNLLYHNRGDGTFEQVTVGPVVTDNKVTFGSGAWADYNRDGFVDLFVADYGFNQGGTANNHNSLYRNDGNSVFTEMTTGSIATYYLGSGGAAWADYNNDGWPDLFVGATTAGGGGAGQSFLYRNNGDGTFASVTAGGIAGGPSVSRAWGDYDNNGFLDLFVDEGFDANPTSNFLYHNNGDGTFSNITSGRIVSDIGSFGASAWGDYDNDGFLDLFACRAYGQKNILYHNNGDGTFSAITTGSLVNDVANSLNCAWGDYDNDGFLDLFVSNGVYQTGDQSNFLYRNSGNNNAWLKVKLVGRVSNRSAIGAKVRVSATIRGKAMTQLREISSLDGLLAHFGLGDATNVDTLRIEWPSGIVQTLTNVAPRQMLTVVEHQALGAIPPRFTGVSHSADGAANLSVTGDTSLLYLFEASTNLANWTKVGVRSNATGIVEFTDPKATNYSRRFYRVAIP